MKMKARTNKLSGGGRGGQRLYFAIFRYCCEDFHFSFFVLHQPLTHTLFLSNTAARANTQTDTHTRTHAHTHTHTRADTRTLKQNVRIQFLLSFFSAFFPLSLEGKTCWGCLLSPTLFNIFLERIMTDALEDHEGIVNIGGRTIISLRFATDIDGIAGDNWLII